MLDYESGVEFMKTVNDGMNDIHGIEEMHFICGMKPAFDGNVNSWLVVMLADGAVNGRN